MKRNFLLSLLAILIASTTVFNVKVYSKEKFKTTRLSGNDRYETSSEISKSIWNNQSKYAVIATGINFPDALSATPLAKKYNAPIFLTKGSTLEFNIESELTRLNTKDVFIIGGVNAVSEQIEAQLKNKQLNVTRISGKDRYETSYNIAKQLGTFRKIIIATGENFPDALSVSSYAAINQIPILLTKHNELPEYVESYIKSNPIAKTYIIGGQDVVYPCVKSKLPNPERIFGKDRYSTNMSIINKFKDVFEPNTIYMATSHNFPDALSSSAAAAQTKSPIILFNEKYPAATADYFRTNIDKINITYIVGGTNAVSDSAVGNLKQQITNASSPLVTPTYDGSYQTTHPKVLYFPNGWNGYKYWMSNTPYPYSNDDYENPSILVSDDGINWTTPGGLLNPIISPHPNVNRGAHYSDPHLVYNSSKNILELWYRYNKALPRGGVDNSQDFIYRVTSSDGIHWSKPQLLYSGVEFCLSPSIILENGVYKMWYVTNKPSYKIRYVESSDGINWTNPKTVNINLEDGYLPWHIDITKTNLGYELLVSNFYKTFSKDNILSYSTSVDGLSFKKVTNIIYPSKSPDAWDNKMIYRSTLVKVDGLYRIYYSAMDKNNQCYIGLTEGYSVENLIGR